MLAKAKNWNCAVVGCDSSGVPKYLGFTETVVEATRLQKSMEAISWQRVTIYDATLREVKDEKRR